MFCKPYFDAGLLHFPERLNCSCVVLDSFCKVIDDRTGKIGTLGAKLKSSRVLTALEDLAVW